MFLKLIVFRGILVIFGTNKFRAQHIHESQYKNHEIKDFQLTIYKFIFFISKIIYNMDVMLFHNIYRNIET